MGFSHSPKIATDNLVFYYDTGNSLKSYKGEPTTNYVTDSSILQNGWNGSYTLLDSSTKSFQLNVNNFHTDGAGWRSFMWDMRSYAGSAVTISATVEVPNDSPGNFAWVMIGQANTRDTGTTTATYLGYSSASERYQKSTSNTERITWSGIVGNTGTANQPNGIIGFTVWYNGGTIGTDSFIKVSNVQIELKSHATPFVNGTRSVTDSLLDLTGTKTINLANSSFTSDALTAFDGSGDYFDLGSDQVFKTTGGWTVESVVKYDVVAGGYNNVTSPANFIGSDTNAYNSWYWSVLSNKLALWNKSPGVWKYGSTTLQANTWYHTVLVCYDSGTQYQMYLNGVAEGGDHTTYSWNAAYAGLRVRYLGAAGSLRYTNGTMPTMKIYDRALSAEEVLQNFNATRSRFGM